MCCGASTSSSTFATVLSQVGFQSRNHLFAYQYLALRSQTSVNKMASFNDVPLTATQRDISIAEIIIFSIPLAVRLSQKIRAEGIFDVLRLVHKVRGNFLLVFCIGKLIL